MGQIITIDFLNNIGKKRLRNDCKILLNKHCSELVLEYNEIDSGLVDRILDFIVNGMTDFEIKDYLSPITCYYLHQKECFEIFFIFQDEFMQEQRLIFSAKYE